VKESVFPRRYILIVAVVMLLAGGGCATTEIITLHDGPPMPQDQVVTLIGRTSPLYVHAVDGKKSPEGKGIYYGNGSYKMNLKPGEHTLSIFCYTSFKKQTSRYAGMNHIHSSSNQGFPKTGTLDLTFTANPGQSYHLVYFIDYDSLKWRAIIKEDANGVPKKEVLFSSVLSPLYKTSVPYKDTAREIQDQYRLLQRVNPPPR